MRHQHAPIFAHPVIPRRPAAPRVSPIHEPDPVGEAPSAARAEPDFANVDAWLIAILDAPLERGETTLVGYRRKEDAIVAVLATLAVGESRAMLARLSKPRAGDIVADKLGRLTYERQQRLLRFLTDARRRAATAARR